MLIELIELEDHIELLCDDLINRQNVDLWNSNGFDDYISLFGSITRMMEDENEQ